MFVSLLTLNHYATQIALALLNARISAKSYGSWSQPFVNSLTSLMLSKFLLILPLVRISYIFIEVSGF